VGATLALAACSDTPEAPVASATATGTSSASTATGTAAAPAAAKVALDKSFGKDGLATVALADSGNQRFMAVTTAPDGKTYAAGFVTLSGGDQAMAVARVDE